MPAFASKRGDRIGVLVEGGNTPLHTHVGTTVFNNFKKPYPYQWKLNEGVTEVVSKALAASGFIPVNLAGTGLRFHDLSGLIVADNDKWRVGPGKEALLDRLRKEHGLKGVILLQEARVLAALECYGGPCAERYADGPGLYTRGFLGSMMYMAVAAHQWNVFVLDSLSDLARSGAMRKKTGVSMPVIRMRGFAPASYQDLTEAEFGQVRSEILRFAESAASEFAQALNPQ